MRIMTEIEKVLVDNLKEALQQLQRYMVFGLGSSLFLLVLSSSHQQSGAGVEIKVPGDFIPGPVPLRMAAAIVVAAYWVAGVLAASAVFRPKRIVQLLRSNANSYAEGPKHNEKLVEAVLTYPSIPTTKRHAPRLMLSILLAILFVAAAFQSGWRPNTLWTFVPELLLVLPYLALTLLLRTTIGGLRPDIHGD